MHLNYSPTCFGKILKFNILKCLKMKFYNKFGKEIKYVKFFYLYENKSTVKPNPKTYTFGVAKSRDFWNDKITEGYNRIDVKTT